MFKKLALVLCFYVSFSVPTAYADSKADADRLMDWAEASFDTLFASGGQQSTSLVIEEPPFAGAWYYRFYSQTGSLIALKDDTDIYLLGGAFGSELIRIDSLAALIELVPSAGECVDIPLPAKNTVAEYQINNIEDGINDGSLILTIQAFSNTESIIESKIIGEDKTITALETNTFEIIDKQLFVTKSMTVSDQTLIDITSTLNYAPALLDGPILTHCQGQTWQTNESTLTASLNPGVGNARPTSAPVEKGSTNAINVSITVPAGVFNTVKRTVVDENGGKIESWIATESGLVVLQKESNSEGLAAFTQKLKTVSLAN